MLEDRTTHEATPPFPCGHDRQPVFPNEYKAECPECGSFWDMDALNSGFSYDKDYPSSRGHYEARIGRNKSRTLVSWLERTGIDTAGMNVCEVGFGGGACLEYLHGVSSRAFGIEAVPENIHHAAGIGISEDSLFHSHAIPERLPALVDLWLFLDSFEHLDSPVDFITWMKANSSPKAIALIVAPESGSLSERVMGRLWPHKLHDHRFHWSRKGMEAFFSSEGFSLTQSFSPMKRVSSSTIVKHALNKACSAFDSSGIDRVLSLFEFTVHFNIGEMGLVFQRTDDNGTSDQEDS